MKLGIENRRNTILAAALAVLAAIAVAYQLIPSSSTSAASGVAASAPVGPLTVPSRTAAKRNATSASGKKERAPQSLDPTLQLQQLAVIEQIKYEGSGRNIFVSQAEVEIPKPLTTGTVGPNGAPVGQYQLPTVPAAAPIPLKFFGFANRPGEPKKIFLSKGEDVFIAAEGEIVDRRYKVVRISPTSVEIQDVVGSGPAQSIPLTQG